MSVKKRSIGVIGQGFVMGSLTTVFHERGWDVFAYDKAGTYAPGSRPIELIQHDYVAKERIVLIPGILNHDEVWIKDSDNNCVYATHRSECKSSIEALVTHCETQDGFSGVYFIAVPTPMREDGSCDLTIIEGALSDLANVPGNKKRIVVVKSTVPPGSVANWNALFNTKYLTVVHSPEFLREATALDDQRNQTRIIIGGPKTAVNKVKQVFRTTFPTVPIVATSSSNSELVKYVTNCFLATKVSFANEIYQIVNALQEAGQDVDFDRIIECATLDERLGKSHWQVPSFEVDENGNPLCGFSLSCFPKDINALMTLARNNGVDPKVMSGAWEKNKEVRPSEDWKKLEGRAVSKKP